MHNYLRILVTVFSLNILLEPALGQDPNDIIQDDKNEKKTQKVTDETPAVELSNEVPMEPDSETDLLSRSQKDDADTTAFWDMDPLNIERETQQKTDVTSDRSLEASDSDPDSLARSQPDSVAARALLRKRLLYGIGGAIPVWLILSGDEDKGVSGSKVGPPPGWPGD